MSGTVGVPGKEREREKKKLWSDNACNQDLQFLKAHWCFLTSNAQQEWAWTHACLFALQMAMAWWRWQWPTPTVWCAPFAGRWQLSMRPGVVCPLLAAYSLWTNGSLLDRWAAHTQTWGFYSFKEKVCDPGVPPDAAVSNLYVIVKGWLYDGSSRLEVGNNKQTADRDSSVLLLFQWHRRESWCGFSILLALPPYILEWCWI